MVPDTMPNRHENAMALARLLVRGQKVKTKMEPKNVVK